MFLEFLQIAVSFSLTHTKTCVFVYYKRKQSEDRVVQARSQATKVKAKLQGILQFVMVPSLVFKE
jgi:hypothetical protein